MPPKGGAKHQKDWSWLEDLGSADEITLAHRRRAAGLGPSVIQKVCPIRQRKDGTTIPEAGKSNGLSGVPERNGNGKRAISVDSTGTESSIQFVKETSCTAKKCAGNPRCYNFLGMDKWWKDDARYTYASEKLGEELSERDGPAGLKNYGATCYANAFLQVWFNNVTFRNGVYEAVGERINPLYHLANIFAMMQESRRPVVDPGALIEALRLNKGSQQDAAEFSKLFMEHIEKQFKAQGGPLADFVREQFAGLLEYRTRCNTCNYTSSTSSAFLEIEIPLQDKCSLENQLKGLLTPELLDGNNKYRCPMCSSLQPATRSTHLKQLPPVLHFALNRFEYKTYSDARVKSKAQISYPRELRLEDSIYDLRGVVVHQGPKATQGHFTCEVFNEAEQEWYFCSDGEVCKLSERPERQSKKVKLDPDVADEQMSKDAYMLVYQRRRPSTSVPRALPPHLMDAIEADNSVVLTDIAERMDKLMTFEEEFDALVAAKEEMLGMIQGDDCVVPLESLSEWFASDTLATKWIVPPGIKCHHGQIDWNSSGLRVISRSAFDKLKQYYDDGKTQSKVCKVSSRSRSHTSVLGVDCAKEAGDTAARPSIGVAPGEQCSRPSSQAKNREHLQPVANGRSSQPLPDSESSEHSLPVENGHSSCKDPTSHTQASSLNEGGLAPDNDDIQFISSQEASFPELDICSDCVRDEFESQMDDTRHLEHIQEFDRVNEGGGTYCLPKAWISNWRKLKLKPVIPPTDPDYSLFCEHDRPFPGDKKYEGVSGETVMFLRSVLGEFPVFEDGADPCDECSAVQAVSKAERADWQAKMKTEEKLSKNHRNQTQVFQTDNYLLPRTFVEQWDRYLKEPVERPILEMDFCCHGKLDFDPGMDRADYITALGWKQLCRLYDFPVGEGICAMFDSRPAPGKRIAVVNVSEETCDECRSTRLSKWDDMWLPITIGETTVPSDSDGSRRRTLPRGAKGKEAQIKVTKETTVKHIRMELYELFKVSPMSQRLLFKGRELDADETVGSVGVLMGDYLNLIEVHEIDDDNDVVMGDEGFGGTALVGQKSCEHCTMLNDPAVTECIVCGLPF